MSILELHGKVWREGVNENGAVNFITGMGGFLQALLFGYGGIRLELHQMRFNPRLPPGINNYTIRGTIYHYANYGKII